MNKQYQHESLWNAWLEAQKEEQRFHIHYSVAGLGLLMTLQTFRQPSSPTMSQRFSSFAKRQASAPPAAL